MKKNKILMIIFFSILFIMFLEIFLYLKQGIQLIKLNNMYKDIELLEDSIDLYYLNNESLPITGQIIDFAFSININDNDNDNFYEIDLNKLDNLKLSYGNKKDVEDIYIINEQSHTIYYVKGIEYDKENYYTVQNNYENVNLEEYQ